jgi:hypothetical protein
MMDAVQKLAVDGADRCVSHHLIKRMPGRDEDPEDLVTDDDYGDVEDAGHLNPSQVAAIKSCDAPLSLIWGPPGEQSEKILDAILILV